jgi:hypothetical protein
MRPYPYSRSAATSFFADMCQLHTDPDTPKHEYSLARTGRFAAFGMLMGPIIGRFGASRPHTPQPPDSRGARQFR